MPNKTIRNKKLGGKKNKSRRIKRGGVIPSLTELAKEREERQRQRQRQPTLSLTLRQRAVPVSQRAVPVSQPPVPDTSMDTEIATRLQREEDGSSSSAASTSTRTPDTSMDTEIATRLQREEDGRTLRATDARPSTPVRRPIRESGGGGEAPLTNSPPARTKRTSSGTRTPTEPAGAVAVAAPQPGLVVPQSFLTYGQVETPFIATWAMSDVQLAEFKRHVPHSSDCAINAMQLLGIIHPETADFMRLTALPLMGLSKEQIEKIIERKEGFKYDYKSCSSYENFLGSATQLKPGRAIFCGIERSNATSHAFIIGRGHNGTLYFIDPQVPIICDINDPECARRILENVTKWFILFQSEQKLTKEQLKQAGFNM